MSRQHCIYYEGDVGICVFCLKSEPLEASCPGPTKEKADIETAHYTELVEALRGAIELLDDCEITHPLKWDDLLAKIGGDA
jgi:hypothetical protein